MSAIPQIRVNQDSAPGIELGLAGFGYADLFDPARLAALTEEFDTHLAATQPDIAQAWAAYRSGADIDVKDESELLVRAAPVLGEFLGRLFGVESEREQARQTASTEVEGLFGFRDTVMKGLAKRFKGVDTAGWDAGKICSAVTVITQALSDIDAATDFELAFGRAGLRLAAAASAEQSLAPSEQAVLNASPQVEGLLADVSDEQQPEVLLEVVRQFCWLVQQDTDLVIDTSAWVIFKTAARTDFKDLVHHDENTRDGYSTWVAPAGHLRRRDGFALTDHRFNDREVQYEVDHCIYCHERDTDSCSKGMRHKEGGYKENPLGVVVSGCPLGEKISEMHLVKRDGDDLGALALVMIDNPMCPGTGHRICNECMKGCIYQKTEPVNIPQIETNVLTNVLFMPWGFEIYSLLTRWNPLNRVRPHALPYNGRKTLVVGLGPAGYTLSHYLLNEGCAVVGIDALKLEPLPDELMPGTDGVPQPIRDFRKYYDELDERVLTGFGGVAEYGITVRWDKNFLKVIYLALLRRQTFRCFGGVRFGGNLTLEEAWDRGFDHVAIASGAGKPTIIGIENNMIRGIRKASDFLMSLQLTGAAKKSSLANLQVRLPAGVIGGGLTAVDTTTELMAYYPVQVEKTLARYEALVRRDGEPDVRARYDDEELEILDEFLEHGRAIRAERERAAKQGEAPDFVPLLKQWGGATLFYRKGMRNSPAYRQNHEEISMALEEGIELAEGMNPQAALADEHGALRAVRFQPLAEEDGSWKASGDPVEVPLRSLFIAAGTAPNTIYEQEFPGTFNMDGKFFQRYEPAWQGGDVELEAVADQALPKIGKPAPLTSYRNGDRYVSFYGDNHPVYAGNVVKAMASAKDGYPYIAQLVNALGPAEDTQLAGLDAFFDTLADDVIAEVVEVKRLTPTIVDVIVRAPSQARGFEPGQFYRVQNLEADAPQVNGTVLAAEGLALTGAAVDKDAGLVSLITLEMGSSSRLCATWQPGQKLIVMGVTGEPTEILPNSTVILVGGGLGNAVQFSIGKAYRAAGARVVYFAGYKKPIDVFKEDDIEAAADVVVWAVDPGEGVTAIPPRRPQDKTFVGNILEAILAYAKGELGATEIELKDADRMIVIGSDRMMGAVKAARHGVLAPYLKPTHTAIGSINSPMQCMMKGICAQCLCRHVDPESGEEYFVYSCYNQDQELDRVDFDNLNARLRQNSVQEKLSDQWLNHLLDETELKRV